jgi:hypothetical protein
MTNNPSSLPSPDSQRTPSKGLAKVLERARADILQRLEKYPFDWDSFDIRLKREEEVTECYESIQSIFLRYPEVFIIDFESLFFQEPGEAINIDREALTKLFETVFTTATINQLEKFFSVISPIYIKDVERALGADSEIESTYLEIEYEKYLLAKQGLNRLEFSEESSNKNNNMERKHIVEQEVKAARSQLEKKHRDSVEKIALSNNVSAKKKVYLFNKAESVVHEIFDVGQKGIPIEEIEEILQPTLQALQQKKGDVFLHRPKPAEAVQAPELHEIAPWKSKDKSGPASKYLQDNYGHLLKRYNHELDRDLICLQDIKVHDKTLWRGLYSEAKKTGTKPSEYVASKSQRTKEAALDTDIGKLRKSEREAARQRQAMRRHGISLESLKNKP